VEYIEVEKGKRYRYWCSEQGLGGAKKAGVIVRKTRRSSGRVVGKGWATSAQCEKGIEK